MLKPLIAVATAILLATSAFAQSDRTKSSGSSDYSAAGQKTQKSKASTAPAAQKTKKSKASTAPSKGSTTGSAPADRTKKDY